MFPWESRRLNAYEAVTQLGLTPALVLDAGDVASYASGSTWSDMSGNDRDFTASSAAFQGAVGGLSAAEYWLMNGSAYFEGTNDTFFDGLHKDGATFTLACLYYWSGAAANGRLLSTKTGSTSSVGVFWGPSGAGTVGFTLSNGSSNQNLANSTATIALNAWNFGAIAVNEAAGAYVHYVNGAHEALSATYTSPSASNASVAVKIGSRGLPDQYLPNGSRVAAFWAFPSALTQASLDALRSYAVARVG